MSKSTHFNGQPIFNQMLSFLNKSEIRKIAKHNNAERYVKKFDTYSHVVVMLFAIFKNHYSIREIVMSLYSNAHKLVHLGLTYLVKRSTFSEANARRDSVNFEQIYQSVYDEHRLLLADTRLTEKEMKRLYIMDSTTIQLFQEILKGVGRTPLTGKKKGGIKVHTIIKADENVPFLIRFSEAIKHDRNFLDEVLKIPIGSIITFDRGYVDYAKYAEFTQAGIWYVTRLKINADYEAWGEHEIPEDADTGVLKDEKITLKYGKNKKQEHTTRRIAYWDAQNERLFVFITNNFELSAETVCQIYKRRWQIELLFKQLKQNFPLKYFFGDNENAIKIQIWTALLANLLMTLVKSKVKRKWSFSNMVTFIRDQLMNYINVYSFLEDPEKSWEDIQNKKDVRYQNSLFPGI